MAVAHRVYAEALLEAAKEKDGLARVRDEFDTFAAALADSDELRAFLRNPQVETETKTGALDELLTGSDELFLNFVHLLAEKGRIAEVSREDLLARAQAWLGVPASSVVREYGMAELTSQCYTGALLGDDPDLFVAPHWVRARLLDPETLEEVPAGTSGLVCVFDLGNLGSALHVLTEDLGVAEGDGFRLLGRAAGAELRGCSLVVEELSGRVP